MTQKIEHASLTPVTRPSEGKSWIRDFEAFLRKEISSKVFSKRMAKHLTSPEWLRNRARREAEELKLQKAGRVRLFELIEEACRQGYQIDYAFTPLRAQGEDSVLVTVIKSDGAWRRGFPSYMCPDTVEDSFKDFLETAR